MKVCYCPHLFSAILSVWYCCFFQNKNFYLAILEWENNCFRLQTLVWVERLSLNIAPHSPLSVLQRTWLYGVVWKTYLSTLLFVILCNTNHFSPKDWRVITTQGQVTFGRKHQMSFCFKPSIKFSFSWKPFSHCIDYSLFFSFAILLMHTCVLLIPLGSDSWFWSVALELIHSQLVKFWRFGIKRLL